MDTWRQWIRHRTACLSGDTTLVFNRPDDNKAYRITVKSVFEKFQPTENRHRPDKQKNPIFKRERVEAMQLRSVNEETGEIIHSNIVDIWESGIKDVYRVTINTSQGVRHVRASKDHRFFTPDGWKTLSWLNVNDEVITITPRNGTAPPVFNNIDPDSEEWAPIVGWENYYTISTQGRVKRIMGGRGSRSHGRCKKLTVSNGRAVTSLNRPGEQTVILVHKEMLRAFVGEPKSAGQESLHNNGNSLDNRIENLRWGSSLENSQDMVDHGHSSFLCAQPKKIVAIEHDGREMTYDLEVSGDWHNFSANDFVVHNSVNEYSTRYSVAIDEFAATLSGEWRMQAENNRQGSDGLLEATKGGAMLSAQEDKFHRDARALYEERLEMGVAREQARKDLPLSNYTEAYWKVDLHNLFGFLRLRMDSHAQQEIREFAEIAGKEIVAKLFPLAWEAFVDYRLEAIQLTKLEIGVVQRMMIAARVNRTRTLLENFEESQDPSWKTLKKCRERDECKEKLILLGVIPNG
jgi:hypothetical protein